MDGTSMEKSRKYGEYNITGEPKREKTARKATFAQDCIKDDEAVFYLNTD